MLYCFLEICDYLRRTFERLITADTLPKLYHDTILLFVIIFIARLFRLPLTALIGRIIKHKNPFLGDYEFAPPPSIPNAKDIALAEAAPADIVTPTAATRAAQAPSEAAIAAPAVAPLEAPVATQTAAPVVAQETPQTIEKYRTAHFYWMGSDLEEALLVLSAKPNYQDFMRTIQQSLRHFKKAGLSDGVIEGKLRRLAEITNGMLQLDWANEQNRMKMFVEVADIKGRIGKLVSTQAGPKFKPWVD